MEIPNDVELISKDGRKIVREVTRSAENIIPVSRTPQQPTIFSEDKKGQETFDNRPLTSLANDSDYR